MKKLVLFVIAAVIFCLSALAAAADPLEVYFNDPYDNPKDRTIQNMILDDLRGAKKTIDVATYNYTDTK